MKKSVDAIVADIRTTENATSKEVAQIVGLLFKQADKDGRKAIMDAISDIRSKEREEKEEANKDKPQKHSLLDDARTISRLLPKAVDAAAGMIAAASKSRTPSKAALEALNKLSGSIEDLAATITGTQKFALALECIRRATSWLAANPDKPATQYTTDLVRGAFNSLTSATNFLLDKASKEGGLKSKESEVLSAVAAELRSANAKGKAKADTAAAPAA